MLEGALAREGVRDSDARWFVGAQFNYAHQVFRHVGAAEAAGFPAIVSRHEKGQAQEISWSELRRQAVRDRPGPLTLPAAVAQGGNQVRRGPAH